ncbi:MAG: hypothetical protein K8S18_19375 [Desulfobacula sp.]|nr:hypothetical protein [Desulfobacula sp.]
MSTNRSANYIFRHAAIQNHSVAKNLDKLAARARKKRRDKSQAITIEDLVASSPIAQDSVAYSPKCCPSPMGYSSSIFGVLILIAGIVAIGFVFGSTLYKILIGNWKTIFISLGGICIGAGIILIFGRIGKKPLKKIEPPDGTSEEPLTELERLANRTVSRLRTAYRIQVSLISVVAAILCFVILWSIYMVTNNRLAYATAFGSSSIGMLALSKWKWQPFERVAEARKLTDDADILATGLRLRINSISQITDPKERAQAQWNAISEYLDRS